MIHHAHFLVSRLKVDHFKQLLGAKHVKCGDGDVECRPKLVSNVHKESAHR